MDELAKKAREVRDFIAEPRLDPAFDREMQRSLEAGRSPPRWTRPAIMAFGVAAAAVVVFSITQHSPAPAPAGVARATGTQPSSSSPTARLAAPLTLRDGSHAAPLGPEGQVDLLSDTASMAELRLARGAARFEVVPNKARRFRVNAGDVSVEALGTVFTVSRLEAGRVGVAVVIGRVRVEYQGGSSELVQGKEGTYPPSPGEALAEQPETVVLDGAFPGDRLEPSKRGVPRGDSNQSEDWRALAETGKFAEAYRGLSSVAVRDEPAELLLAADVARQSGHPADAVRYLSSILERHAKDPRASVAAFTLGRLYESLGRPAQAAQAFHRAQSLRGTLAGEALAHEADAWAKAGDSARARERAQQYVTQYPRGSEAQRFRVKWGLK